MSDLFVAGEWFGQRETMVNIGNRDFKLWAFDDCGRAIDPGRRRLVVEPHGNDAVHEPLGARRRRDAPSPLPIGSRSTSSTPPRARSTRSPARARATRLERGDVTVLVTHRGHGAPCRSPTRRAAADDAPVPLMAMLPNGRYGANGRRCTATVPCTPTSRVTTSGSASSTSSATWSVRPARPPTAPTPRSTRRADDQNRATTRVAVNAVAPAGLVMHTSLDAVAAA